MTAFAALVAAFGLAACGGGGEGNGSGPARTTTDAARSTPAPTATATPKPRAKLPSVKGIDVRAVNRARFALTVACRKRAKAPEDRKTLPVIRRSTSRLIKSFRVNPNERFRRGPRFPLLSMRDRLLEMALVTRTKCGGGSAVKEGNRLVKAAAEDL